MYNQKKQVFKKLDSLDRKFWKAGKSQKAHALEFFLKIVIFDRCILNWNVKALWTVYAGVHQE